MANERKHHSVSNNAELTMRVYLHSFSTCCIPSLLNSPNIQTYSSSRSSKVIDFGANRKHICNFLLVIDSNFRCISYRFQDIDAFWTK